MRHLILTAAFATCIAIAAAGPRLPQDPAYHAFADQRTLLGIPNCLNVLSNLPFLAIGVAGVVLVIRRKELFRNPWERWPYAALFAGTALMAFGSTWYHLAPDNARLVWDRLPMTAGFMGLLVAIVAERLSVAAARILFAPLVILGASSVLYWYWSELAGRGDLRFYAAVQFGSLLLVLF